jgi:hypothetical protein
MNRMMVERDDAILTTVQHQRDGGSITICLSVCDESNTLCAVALDAALAHATRTRYATRDGEDALTVSRRTAPGSVSVNVLPRPSLLCAVSVPPWACAMY